MTEFVAGVLRGAQGAQVGALAQPVAGAGDGECEEGGAPVGGVFEGVLDGGVPSGDGGGHAQGEEAPSQPGVVVGDDGEFVGGEGELAGGPEGDGVVVQETGDDGVATDDLLTRATSRRMPPASGT